jgi:hypothetical protein
MQFSNTRESPKKLRWEESSIFQDKNDQKEASQINRPLKRFSIQTCSLCLLFMYKHISSKLDNCQNSAKIVQRIRDIPSKKI